MNVIINGQTFNALPGETVLTVAKKNGIYIPSLCYHPKIGSLGRCRACVVSVEGVNGYQTSCNLPVKEGMIVRSDTEEVKAHQRLMVDLVLSSGKHDCLSCEQNGMCELQDACYYLGLERPSFNLFVPSQNDIDKTSEMVYVDRTKCILCGRCVEGCNNTVVHEVITVADRGFESEIVFDNDVIMGESTCTQCGECVQLCPVGALIDKNAIGKGRPWEIEKVKTVCPYCGVGCQIYLHIHKVRKEIIRVTGAEEGPVNKGMLCIKGRYGQDFVGSKERLTMPLVRNSNGEFEETSWMKLLVWLLLNLKILSPSMEIRR
jgi:predicted molibdopterin-dependent oxidoreductase YjgC